MTSMKIPELRVKLQYRGTKKFYSDISEFPQRLLSIYITAAIVNSRIKPNTVSLVNIMVGFGAYVCFAIGGTGWFAAGLFVLFLNLVCDCVDGEIARFRNKTSLTGLYLDRFNAILMYPLTLYSISIGAYNVTGNLWIVLWGCTAGMLYLFLRIAYSNAIVCAYEGLVGVKGGWRESNYKLKGKYSEGMEGALVKHLRKGSRGRSKVIEWAMQVYDFFLSRGLGLFALLTITAGFEAAGFVLKIGGRDLQPRLLFIILYGLLALIAMIGVTFNIVKEMYPDKVCAQIAQKSTPGTEQ